MSKNKYNTKAVKEVKYDAPTPYPTQQPATSQPATSQPTGSQPTGSQPTIGSRQPTQNIGVPSGAPSYNNMLVPTSSLTNIPSWTGVPSSSDSQKSLAPSPIDSSGILTRISHYPTISDNPAIYVPTSSNTHNPSSKSSNPSIAATPTNDNEARSSSPTIWTPAHIAELTAGLVALGITAFGVSRMVSYLTQRRPEEIEAGEAQGDPEEGDQTPEWLSRAGRLSSIRQRRSPDIEMNRMVYRIPYDTPVAPPSPDESRLRQDSSAVLSDAGRAYESASKPSDDLDDVSMDD